MTKAASDILVTVEELGRYDRNKTIYRTLNVTEQKNFRSVDDFMKDATSRRARDMCAR